MSKSDTITTKDRDLLTILLNAKDRDDALHKLIAAGATRTQAKALTFGLRHSTSGAGTHRRRPVRDEGGGTTDSRTRNSSGESHE